MKITKETIIGEVVANDYNSASVFKQFGIDFCCNGNRTIEEACNKDNISSENLISVLNNISNQKSDSGLDYRSWPLDLLADYIEKKHHRYVATKILEIVPFLETIVQVHGSRHQELSIVEKLFKESAEALTAHMKKEEQVLFPYIREMVNHNPAKGKLQPVFGSAINPIRAMMVEHDTEGERFRTISGLTNNYLPPADACNTYRATLALIKEFEEDLHLHIHLENNILFPGAIKMEER